jgi:hypothetical protein
MEIEGEPVAKPWHVWNGPSLLKEFGTFAEAEAFRSNHPDITGDITHGPKRYRRGEMPS